MGIIKNIIKKYVAGAKANYFPVSKCGLFGEKLNHPVDLEEALYALDKIIDHNTKRIVQELSEEKVSAMMHHSLGRHIRNKWGLWDNSKLSKWFKRQGIFHPDDMSGIIITSYWRQQQNQPIKLQEQIDEYKRYWANMEEE